MRGPRDSERQRHTHRNTERSTERQRDTETEEGRRDGEGVKVGLLREDSETQECKNFILSLSFER